MIRTLFAAAALAFTGLLASAQPTTGWRAPDGTILPDAPNRRSVNGFGAWLLITDDADWAKKWDTPSHTVPMFSEAKNVQVGGRLAILVFYASPQPDPGGNVEVLMDLRVTRPDGTTSANAEDARCWSGLLSGSAANVRLCEAYVMFIAEPSDLRGIWSTEVTVKDMNRQAKVPLHAEFELRD